MQLNLSFSPFLLSVDENTLHTYIEEAEGLQYYKEDLFELYRYKKTRIE